MVFFRISDHQNLVIAYHHRMLQGEGGRQRLRNKYKKKVFKIKIAQAHIKTGGISELQWTLAIFRLLLSSLNM